MIFRRRVNVGRPQLLMTISILLLLEFPITNRRWYNIHLTDACAHHQNNDHDSKMSDIDIAESHRHHRHILSSGDIESCGYEEPTQEERYEDQINMLLWSFQKSGDPDAPPINYTIPTYFHILQDSSTDLSVPDSNVDLYINYLSNAFNASNAPFRFPLMGITRTVNKTWANDCQAQQGKYKPLLKRGGKETLNVYVCNAIPLGPNGGSITGFSTGPTTNSINDGVNIVRTTPTDLNRPNTLVHEVGHFLGLLHTFVDNCNTSRSGDLVDDTPYHISLASTVNCLTSPTTWDTCPTLPGLDPVDNYMTYTTANHVCRTRFTPGQVERMRAQFEIYRYVAPPPTKQPTKVPTKQPTKRPTMQPTKTPTKGPTKIPSRTPTRVPISKVPTGKSPISPTAPIVPLKPLGTPIQIPIPTSPITPVTYATSSPATKSPTKIPISSQIDVTIPTILIQLPTFGTSSPVKHATAIPVTNSPTYTPIRAPVTTTPKGIPVQLPILIPSQISPLERTTSSPTKIPTRSPDAVTTPSIQLPTMSTTFPVKHSSSPTTKIPIRSPIPATFPVNRAPSIPISKSLSKNPTLTPVFTTFPLIPILLPTFSTVTPIKRLTSTPVTKPPTNIPTISPGAIIAPITSPISDTNPNPNPTNGTIIITSPIAAPRCKFYFSSCASDLDCCTGRCRKFLGFLQKRCIFLPF